MRPYPQFPADLVTFTEEILNGKLHFLYIETKSPSSYVKFCIFELVEVPSFIFCTFNKQFEIWAKFAKKGYFWSKAEKENIKIEFSIFKLMLAPNISLNTQLWIFEQNLSKQSIPAITEKSKHHHRIKLIRISVDTKFHLKQAIFIFWE